MTKRESPCPKLRVTFRSSIPFFAHDAQTGLDKVDGDDEESANLIELDDCFCRLALDSAAADNELDFPRFMVALAFDDLPGVRMMVSSPRIVRLSSSSSSAACSDTA